MSAHRRYKTGPVSCHTRESTHFILYPLLCPARGTRRREAFETHARRNFSQVRSTQAYGQSVEEAE